MRSYKTEGIIIKRKNYNEADRILTVFTKSHGKIQIKATGIRKIPSRRAYHVELLNYSLLSLYQGRNMPILTEVQTIKSFTPIQDDLQTIGSAYHICEIIDGLCPENQENPQVFDLLKQILHRLSHSSQEDTFSRDSLLSDTSTSYPPFLKGDRRDFNAPQATGPHPFAMVQESTNPNSLINNFEFDLLCALGYLDKNESTSPTFNPRDFIEDILERKLKTYPIFAKLQ
jgi:recombinational DNA repair protein (RecF pathway)